MASYKGRHRKPSTAGKTVARVATTGIIAAVPMGLAVTPAQAAAPVDVREAIAQCESGGNYHAQNSSSTASGKYQFINGTWKAYGGSTARAKDASPAEQDVVFERAFAAEGTGPWEASYDCWHNKVGSVQSAPKHAAPREAPQSNAPRHAAPSNAGRAADGSGSYTCDAAHLYFNACDPHNIGEVVNYPTYSGRAVHIAVAVNTGSRGTYVCDKQHLYYEACDPGNLGETVAYPRKA